MTNPTDRYFRYALWLAYFTIFYNLLEGLVSIHFGITDETLALFGFGMDSFIEVFSGFGILAMIYRIRRHPDTHRSKFEISALRVTGICFYLLTFGLGLTAVINIINNHKPDTTIAGTIIAIISIAAMAALVMAKRKVGYLLNSAPILADANCTLVCIYMSMILLASSLVYEFTGFGYVDSLGALGLMYFSIREGREALEKARGLECSCEIERGN